MNALATMLPWFEVFCGVLLVLGIAVRGTALLLAGMLVLSACGGSTTPAQRAYGVESAFDLAVRETVDYGQRPVCAATASETDKIAVCQNKDYTHKARLAADAAWPLIKTMKLISTGDPTAPAGTTADAAIKAATEAVTAINNALKGK